MSGAEFWLLSAVVLLGALAQASIGFGLGLLAAPVVALVDPTLVPVTLILLATGVTATVLVLDRQHVDLRGTGIALGGRVVGTVAGAALVAALPARALAVAVGVVVLLGVVATAGGLTPRPTTRAVALAGAVSGLMGTATSIGGPPMAMVWQGMAGPRLRGTMSGFFLVGSLLSLAALAVAGNVEITTLQHTLWLLPAALAGVLLARRVSRALDSRRSRTAAMALASIGAVVLIGQQVL
ncbi:permease [Actinoalloteichus sp. AHMU CJ021]|uniref:sulfite exporter TauE/SafE family protein n=1 Tax=Actinoalloteichus sp. AHMU CJ021 TaxID=2072503 RepID=UPI000CA01F69|nr:permease [Actinoalloteichus sp. AHMU CJ021]